MLCKTSRKTFIKEKNDGRRIDAIEELMVWRINFQTQKEMSFVKKQLGECAVETCETFIKQENWHKWREK